jgi:hypothetical protein
MAKRAKVRQYTQSISTVVTEGMYDSISDYCQTHNIGVSEFLRYSVEVYLHTVGGKNVGN